MTKAEKDIALLKETVAHWEQVLLGKETGSALTCPLCKQYQSSNCSGCPIQQETKLSDCRATPWEKWHEYHAYRVLRMADTNDDESKRLTIAEINFLKGLLSKHKKQLTNETTKKIALSPSLRVKGCATPRSLEAMAILATLVHWYNIRDNGAYVGGTANCPLCQTFGNTDCDARSLAFCDVCPVRHFTGHAQCMRTPYNDFRNVVNETKERYVNLPFQIDRGNLDARRAATKVIIFIKQLYRWQIQRDIDA